MAAKNQLGITVSKSEDIVEWYSQLVLKSGLADYSAVKGCPVLRPHGYALWQGIMDYFNQRLALLGVENAYFPLFIPESFFHKEADHIEGFAPEVAWIERKSEDEPRIAVRPTSETIMYDSYAKWIQSYRDLPLRINQWANVVRWEVKDVKIFLRGREFLWQEGHCVYETEQEAADESLLMIKEYQKLSEELLAVPAYIGLKSQKEKFPGAQYTYTIESFMPDGKALQAGTSHHLGQGFAHSFGIQFKGRDEALHHPYQTSWGFSTRLLGSLIMTHGDDNGLILPPKIAPKQVVIVPIFNKKYPEDKQRVLNQAETFAQELLNAGIRVHIDTREGYSPGFKYNHWELQGVPLRVELGPRDLEKEQLILAKRNTGEQLIVSFSDVSQMVLSQLEIIQKELFEKAKQAMQDAHANVSTYDELVQATTQENKYALAPHCGEEACEELIKQETGGVTTRCRPLDGDSVSSTDCCIKCGKKAAYKVLFSRNY